ncbi:hypothetical protein M5K25_014111 [Dendrobium thyrsiflorum]|uniref:DUF4283 domain-containing protein n=1 Tax=Dendrobium thyrsiflorum TaxID=117978 RepID=A0ABD0UUW5_DENTH
MRALLRPNTCNPTAAHDSYAHDHFNSTLLLTRLPRTLSCALLGFSLAPLRGVSALFVSANLREVFLFSFSPALLLLVFHSLRDSSTSGLIGKMAVNRLVDPVDFFPSMRPSLDSIRRFFFNLKLNDDVSVTLLDQSHILVKLVNDLDYSRVFFHRSYLVNNCYMKLTKWSPLVDIGAESPVILIWISFPNLRPHLFSPFILHGLGLLFGRPLKVDNAIAVGTRPYTARVLVEIDVTKKYIDKASDNAILSNPINPNAHFDMNAPCVVKTLDNITSIVPFLPIKAMVVNEEIGLQTANEVDPAIDGIGLVSNLVVPNASPSVNSCGINVEEANIAKVESGLITAPILLSGAVVLPEGVNTCLENSIPSPIVSLCSNVGEGVLVGGNSDCIFVSDVQVESNVVATGLTEDMNVEPLINAPIISNSNLPCAMGPKANAPFVDVSIELISSKDLKVQLDTNIMDTCMNQNDWLDGSFSLSCKEAKDDIVHPTDDFQEGIAAPCRPSPPARHRRPSPPVTAGHHLRHRRPPPSFYIAITLLQTKQKKRRNVQDYKRDMLHLIKWHFPSIIKKEKTNTSASFRLFYLENNRETTTYALKLASNMFCVSLVLHCRSSLPPSPFTARKPILIHNQKKQNS